MSVRRLTGVVGVMVAVLFVVGNALWALEQPQAGASSRMVLAFYDHASGRVIAGASMSLAAGALFVLFAAGLRRVLDEVERDGVLGMTAFGGGLLVVAAGLGAETMNMAGALRAENGRLPAALGSALFKISYDAAATCTCSESTRDAAPQRRHDPARRVVLRQGGGLLAARRQRRSPPARDRVDRPTSAGEGVRQAGARRRALARRRDQDLRRCGARAIPVPVGVPSLTSASRRNAGDAGTFCHVHEFGGIEVAQEVEFGKGGEGKIRSFWVGTGLVVLTLGIYAFCWYYFVNDELKDIGISKDDQNLGQSSPTMSVVALVIGGWVIIPPLLSVYNFGQRIKRAQRLTGVPKQEQINPITAFLLYFPGALLIVPLFFHYWYVTKHQNMALRAASGLPYAGGINSPTAEAA